MVARGPSALLPPALIIASKREAAASTVGGACHSRIYKCLKCAVVIKWRRRRGAWLAERHHGLAAGMGVSSSRKRSEATAAAKWLRATHRSGGRKEIRRHMSSSSEPVYLPAKKPIIALEQGERRRRPAGSCIRQPCAVRGERARICLGGSNLHGEREGMNDGMSAVLIFAAHSQSPHVWPVARPKEIMPAMAYVMAGVSIGRPLHVMAGFGGGALAQLASTASIVIVLGEINRTRIARRQ